MRAPVSVCIIVKNEPLIEECLKHIRDYVQEIVVVDTGSSDNTPELAKKYADIFEVYTGCNDPETGLINDFSDARKRSFELATQKWILWIDSDDIVDGLEHLPKLISDYENNKGDLEAIGYLFKYEYSYDQNGNCTLEHFRERLISDKNKFHWVNPVHEVLIPNNNVKVGLITRDEVVYKHRRQYSKKTPEGGRNLRILKKYFDNVQDGNEDARQLYYYGLELSNANQFDEAIKYLTKYINVSGWDDERVMACLKLVEISQKLGKYQDGLIWGFKAIEIKEDWAEGYFAVAKMFYFLATLGGPNENKYYQKCVNFIEMGQKLPETQTLLFKNPVERNVEIHRFLNMALNKLGKVKEALDSVNSAIKFEPNDPALFNNKKLYEIFLSTNDALGAINKLVEHNHINNKSKEYIIHILNNNSLPDNLSSKTIYKVSDDWNIPENYPLDNLPLNLSNNQLESSFIMLWQQYMLTNEFESGIKFLENVPGEIKNSEKINQALFLSRDFISKNNLNDTSKLDIIFFAGDGLEIWTPETVKKTGIGGSELMLLEQAKRFAKSGHRVRVYNSCGNLEGKYDGVEYYNTQKFNNLKCDVLIISRRADMLDDKYNIKAKLKLLWVHDVFALNAKPNLLLKADRILALSYWHKQNLIKQHNIHPDQVIITRNGIDLNRFNKKIEKNKFKCINSSSPDRSWPILLEIWPEIRRQVSQAELHLFYGFENWKKVAQNDKLQMNLITHLENQIKDMKNLGVVFHDRVNQDKLAEEMLSSSIWVYPTWFSETSCISVMEAQAAGLKMVTSNIAALKETAGERATLLDGEWTSPEYKKQFIDQTVKELLNYNEDERIDLQKYAQENFGLDDLNKKWENMFISLIDEIKTSPIIPYQPSKAYL